MSYRYAVSNKPTEREPGGPCRLLDIDNPSNQSEGGFAFDPNLKSDLLETSPEHILVRNSQATASFAAPQPPRRISHHNQGTQQYSNPSPDHKSSSSESDYRSALPSSSSEEYIVKPTRETLSIRPTILCNDLPYSVSEVFEDGVLGLRDIVTILYVNDVHNLIFKRLSLRSKLSVRLVCRQWKEVMDGMLNFNPILSDSTVAEVEEFAASRLPVNVLTVSQFQRCICPPEGLQFPSVNEIRVVASKTPLYPSPHVYTSMEARNPNAVSEINLARILTEFRNINILTLESVALEAVGQVFFLTDVSLPSLKSLNLASYTGHLVGRRAIKDFLMKNYFPQLDNILFTMLNEGNPTHFQGPIEYEETFNFIARHCLTLSDINLQYASYLHKLYAIQLFQSFTPKQQEASFRRDIESLQLDALVYRPHIYEGAMGHDYGIHLFRCQTHLSTLHLKEVECLELFNDIPHVIEACSDTLKEVILTGFISPALYLNQGLEAGYFPCSCLRNCHQLETLFMEIYTSTAVQSIHEIPFRIQNLSLGSAMHREQIDFILSGHFGYLKHIKLLQGKSSDVPQIDSELFKQVLGILESLERLTLSKMTSAYKRIRKMVWYTQGLTLEDETCAPFFDIVIDNMKFDRDRFMRL